MKTLRQSSIAVLLLGFVGANYFVDTSASSVWQVTWKTLITTGIFLLAYLWWRMENRQHQKNLEEWGSIRRDGRTHFILWRYILRRGGVIVLVVFGLFFKTFVLTYPVLVVLSATLLLMAVTLVLMGNEEWKTCEREFEILTLRRAAEQSRKLASLQN